MGIVMQKSILLSAGVAVLLASAFGVASNGNENDKDTLTRLVELQSLNRRLNEMTDSLGPEAPEVVNLRQRVEMWREVMHKQSTDRLDSAHISQVLQVLEDSKATDKQLQESVLTLTKEIIILRNRVTELERSTTVRIVPLNR
jgi:septal ring factor EnvC (AmiA/AmiB activator)